MVETITIKEYEDPFDIWVAQRIARNRNVNIIITGDTGTGKTLSAITLGISLDKRRFTSENIVTNISDLYNKLVEKLKLDLNYKGEVIQYEEPQEEQYKMKSTTHEATSFVQVLSTFRSLNMILIMTTPRQGDMQKSARSYFDVWIQTKRIDYKKELCYCSLKIGSYDESSGKMKWEFMRIRYKGELCIMNEVMFRLPPKEISDAYEQSKKVFQLDSYETKLKTIRRKHKKQEADF